MEYRDDRQETAALFAELVNSKDENDMSPEQLRHFAEDLKQLLSPKYQAEFTPEAVQASPHNSLVNRERDLIRSVQLNTRRWLPHLLEGKGVTLDRPHSSVVYRLKGSRMVEELQPPRSKDEEISKKLFDLLKEKRFPFGLCIVCHKVFVQSNKGKSRRYCSEPCKAKGVPSAAKRTEYVREQRQKQRRQELRMVKDILRKWTEGERWQKLQKAFPKKTRRQLLYLMKKAQQKQKKEG